MRKAFINAKLLRDGKIAEGAFAIENGYKANFLRISDDLSIKEVYVEGEKL